MPIVLNEQYKATKIIEMDNGDWKQHLQKLLGILRKNKKTVGIIFEQSDIEELIKYINEI